MRTEQRHDQRIRSYLPVRLHTPYSPRMIETLTKDLSIGGLRCLSPMLCPVSTELGVEVQLSPSEGQLNARGKLTWFQTLPESEQFECGIRFIDLTPENKQRLSAYLDRLSQKSALYPA